MASYQLALRGKAVNIVYQHTKQIYLPVGISVQPDLFNPNAPEGKWIARQHTDSHQLNILIAERLNEVKASVNRFFLDNHHYPPAHSLKGFFNRNKQDLNNLKTLWRMFELQKTHQGAQSVGVGRLQLYQLTLRYLLEYQPTATVNKIDVAFYSGFKHFLLSTKGCSENRVGAFINVLKTFLNWAIEGGHCTTAPHTVRKFKTTWNQRDIIFHPAEEIQMLFDVNLRDYPQLIPARDAYLIQCLTGLRYSDSRREYEWNITNGLIHLRAQKTRAEITIPIRTELALLLHSYTSANKPLPTFNDVQVYNRAIKRVAELAGITQYITLVHGRKAYRAGQRVRKCDILSSHNARATFICTLIDADIQSFKIMAMTGIKQVKTIDHYAAVVKKNLAGAMAQVEQRAPLRVSHIAKTA